MKPIKNISETAFEIKSEYNKKALQKGVTFVPFTDEESVIKILQEDLDAIPKKIRETMLGELLYYGIKLEDSPSNNITTLVKPEGVLFSKATSRLRGHGAGVTYVFQTLGATKDNRLILELMADKVTPDGYLERTILPLSEDEFYYNKDWWEAISEEDQAEYAKYGIRAGMENKDLGAAINAYPGRIPTVYALKGSTLRTNKLPSNVSIDGIITAEDGTYPMTRYTAKAVLNNTHLFNPKDINKEKPPFEYLTLHLHFYKLLTGAGVELANYFGGSKNFQSLASWIDFLNALGARVRNYQDVKTIYGVPINATEMYVGTGGVDLVKDDKGNVLEAQVSGIKIFDTGSIPKQTLEKTIPILNKIQKNWPNVDMSDLKYVYKVIADHSSNKFPDRIGDCELKAADSD